MKDVNGFLVVSDEVKEIASNVYHEKFWSTEFTWDENSLSETEQEQEKCAAKEKDF